MSIAKRFLKSALWVKARESEDFKNKTDEEVFAEVCRRMNERFGNPELTPEQLELMAYRDSLLRAAPHIISETMTGEVLPGERYEMPFGGYEGSGRKYTCGNCGCTSMTASLAEFVVDHAACEATPNSKKSA